MEIFQECSNRFSKGKKIYQSLYTFNGEHVPNLENIPEGCKLLIVSEQAPPTDYGDTEQQQDQEEEADTVTVVSQKPLMGLKNNLYDF